MAKAILMIRDLALREQALRTAEKAGKETDPVKRRELNQTAVRLWLRSTCRLYSFEQGDAQ